METAKDVILGIDLGTTNSGVSVIRDGKAEVLEEDGTSILPSVVGLDAEGRLLVGVAARNQLVLAPERTVRSIKRKMGSDETVSLGGQMRTPQEISAIILRALKERAARRLGRDAHRAVITVPAFFNEQQREATREAGELAGLEVVRIINEPTAASLTYNASQEGLERLLVYDLGGGTFDVSIVQIEEGVVEVLASHGDTRLGGDDFDQLLLDHVCDRFQESHDVDLRLTVASRSRVLRAVEEAKMRLSSEPFTTVQEEFIADKAGMPLHLDLELSRQEYELLIEPLLNKTLVCIDEAMSDAGLTAGKIDRVVLVGGSSRTPMVQRLLSEQLRQPIHSEVDPDLCVTMGAAIQGGMISGIDVGPVLVDITPHTLGIQCLGDLQGFESKYVFSPLIQRNTALPAARSEVFRTISDGQEKAEIRVFQGENQDVRHNDLVGEFTMEGLAEVSAGNEILVRFDLDLDGILKVTASEKETGLRQAITIDSAVSRARGGHREVRERIDAAFESAGHRPALPGGAQSADGGELGVAETGAALDEDLPAELRTALAKASDLLEKSEQLAADANPADAQEMAALAGQLRSAIRARSLDDIEKSVAALDDLVFYLRDV